jgi:transposase InsO family protein
VLRSNNGGEYTSKDFDAFCKKVRMKKELIVLYNPKQNDVANRKNRSIIETAKAMIQDLDLPTSLDKSMQYGYLHFEQGSSQYIGSDTQRSFYE